jgi:glycosyltransferase involved in cell wall biosynthesis
MIIGIDANEANVKRKVGISEYAYQLLLEFNKLKNLPMNKDLEFRIYLKDKPSSDLPPEDKKWQYNVFGPRPLWTQIALPWNLFTHKPCPDVFFTTSHYAPRFSPIPTVVSVMDVSYLYFQDMFKKADHIQLKRWTSYSVKKAARVLTISKSSKNDIIKEYNMPEEKVVVVYPGVKPTACLESSVYGMNTIKAKYGISDNFILFVGTLQPRKNIVRLIEAFAKASGNEKISHDLQLVIVGKKGWMYEEILKKPKELKIEEKVKFLDFVSDDELIVLYQHAICFILPSLYEGFGLPVLEAMKHGCPVITSNISSLPEAAGDAAVYIDPEDVEDIAEKIFKVVTHPELRQELKEKGKAQLVKFSWEKTARATLKVLEEVAASK